MYKPRRVRNNPGFSVPEDLLFSAFRWETVREQYLLSNRRMEEAGESHLLRIIYSKRLWSELGISVDLQ